MVPFITRLALFAGLTGTAMGGPAVRLDIAPDTHDTALYVSNISPGHSIAPKGIQVLVEGGRDTAIGIDVALNASSRYVSKAYGIRSSPANASETYGLYATAKGEVGAVGVYGAASLNGKSKAASAVGVLGTTDASDGKGVVGYGPSGIGVYGEGLTAGWFDGNVVITGDCDPCTPSDEMFKTNIETLSGGLSKVMALRPKAYDMKANEFKDRIKLPSKRQFGFVAQDVAKVLPDLVNEVSVPSRATSEKGKIDANAHKFTSVNYREVIPDLVAAIQEQQAQIEALKSTWAASTPTSTSNSNSNSKK
jgi:hypothetical protein